MARFREHESEAFGADLRARGGYPHGGLLRARARKYRVGRERSGLEPDKGSLGGGARLRERRGPQSRARPTRGWQTVSWTPSRTCGYRTRRLCLRGSQKTSSISTPGFWIRLRKV